MSDKIGRLNPYGYDSGIEKLTPYKCCCCDTSKDNCDRDNKQDEEINKRVTIDDFDKAIGEHTKAINKNIDAISSLTSGVNATIDAVNTKNEEQDNKISGLSDSLAALSSGTSELSSSLSSNTALINSITTNLQSNIVGVQNNLVTNITDVQNALDSKIERVRQTADSGLTVAETSYKNAGYNRELIDDVSKRIKGFVADETFNNLKTTVDSLINDLNSISGSLKSDYATSEQLKSATDNLTKLSDDLTKLYVTNDKLENYALSADVRDNYYTKAETSSSTEINDELTALRIQFGNAYLSKDYADKTYATINDYATKTDLDALHSTVDILTEFKNSFPEYTSKIDANIASISSLTKQIEAVSAVSKTNTENISSFEGDYETLSTGISKNATDITKISDLKINSSDAYDNSGNGILDVLHREFHKAFKSYGDADLDDIIKKLEDRISKLENKVNS